MTKQDFVAEVAGYHSASIKVASFIVWEYLQRFDGRLDMAIMQWRENCRKYHGTNT